MRTFIFRDGRCLGEHQFPTNEDDHHAYRGLEHPSIVPGSEIGEAMLQTDGLAPKATRIRTSFMEAMANRIASTEQLRKLLSQDKIWVDAQGAEIKVSSIDARYAENLLRWLERRAQMCHSGAEAVYLFLPYPNGAAAQDSFDDEYNTLLELTPMEWMKRQALYRALEERSKDKIALPRAWRSSSRAMHRLAS